MAVITWLGGSSTDGAVAANWSGGSLPGASDTIVFDNNSTQNCIFSSSAISQVVQIQIKSTFDHQIVFGTSSHAISLHGSGEYGYHGKQPNITNPEATGVTGDIVITNASAVTGTFIIEVKKTKGYTASGQTR